MTLVELMVALAIGLFLTSVAIAMFLGSKSSFVAQENDSRIQEKARYVLATLAEDLRMSGFRGCRAPQPPSTSAPSVATMASTLNSATSVRYDYLSPVWATQRAGSAWSPAMPAEYAGLGATSSLVVVRRPVGAAWALIGDMPVASADLRVEPSAAFAAGDILLAADCIGAAVFQATSSAAAGVIQHALGGGFPPGNASVDLPRTFSQDASVWRMQTRAYFIAPSQTRAGASALWVHRWPQYGSEPVASELASGVERMAIALGVDTNADDTADAYVAPAAVADWSQVVSVRVQLLMVGDVASAVSGDPIVFDGQSVSMADRRPRVVLHSLVSLRNRLP